MPISVQKVVCEFLYKKCEKEVGLRDTSKYFEVGFRKALCEDSDKVLSMDWRNCDITNNNYILNVITKSYKSYNLYNAKDTKKPMPRYSTSASLQEMGPVDNGPIWRAMTIKPQSIYLTVELDVHYSLPGKDPLRIVVTKQHLDCTLAQGASVVVLD